MAPTSTKNWTSGHAVPTTGMEIGNATWSWTNPPADKPLYLLSATKLRREGASRPSGMRCCLAGEVAGERDLQDSREAAEEERKSRDSSDARRKQGFQLGDVEHNVLDG